MNALFPGGFQTPIPSGLTGGETLSRVHTSHEWGLLVASDLPSILDNRAQQIIGAAAPQVSKAQSSRVREFLGEMNVRVVAERMGSEGTPPSRIEIPQVNSDRG